MRYGTPEVAELLKFTSAQIQHGGQPQNFPSLNRYNSAVERSISPKFGTEFDHVTADILQVLKVKFQRSRSHCKCQSIAKIFVPYKKSESPNPTTVSEFGPEARKTHSTKTLSSSIAEISLVDC